MSLEVYTFNIVNNRTLYYRNSKVTNHAFGTPHSIESKLGAYRSSCAFRYRDIQKDPCYWAACYIYICKFSKIEIKNPNDLLLCEILENTESNIWIENRDITSLLLANLIKFSDYFV